MAEEGEKKFTKVGQLKENSFVLIDGFPCQIKEFEKSKPGKHGSAKARITAIGYFDGQKRNLMKPTEADAEVPIIEKGVAQVVAIMGDSVQVMDTTTFTTFDCKKPEDVPGLASGTEIEFARYGPFLKITRKR
ncbi:MAG: translation initiation factor IF-5A [Candidatus Diapherotrites archaeon]|nr:translation initiation factor IF-5A [Candidatus Diapherotrites archaeon]